MTNIYFLRHGEVINPNNVIYGNLPFLLSESGKNIIKKASKILKECNISSVFSSPIQRCIESTEIVTSFLGGQKYHILDALTEAETFEYWVGTPISEIKRLYSKQWDTFINNTSEFAPNGISLVLIANRMYDAVKMILKKYEGKNILCVSHADPIKSLLCLLDNRPYNDVRKIRLKYGSVIKFTFHDHTYMGAEIIFKGDGYFNLS